MFPVLKKPVDLLFKSVNLFLHDRSMGLVNVLRYQTMIK